jgi:hypothetical protein
MKIGIIAPDTLIHMYQPILVQKFPSILFVPYIYHSFPDIPGILMGHQHEADALLFMGQSAMQYASHFVSPAVPWSATTKTPASCLVLLVQAALKQLPMKIATDVEDRALFEEAFHDAEIEEKEIHIRPVREFSPQYARQDASTLLSLVRSGAASFCITKFAQVRDLLEKEHVPVFLLRPTTENVIYAARQLILSSYLKNESELQTAVLRLHLDTPELSASPTTYALHTMYLEAAPYVQRLAERMKAAIIPLSSADYVLITSRPMLERETLQFKEFSLIHVLPHKTGLTLSAGIGLGRNAQESDRYAVAALERARSAGGGKLFLLGEQGRLIGPITSSSAPHFDLPSEKLSTLSARSGVSLRYLTLLYMASKEQGKTHFIPSELADILGVSLRTMNRIILKLMDCGVCRETGRHFTHQNGRPSRIIEIKFT